MSPNTFRATELPLSSIWLRIRSFPAASKSTIIRELFNEGQIDPRLWGNPGGPGYLALGQGGLTMNGGNGFDGQTALTWIDPVEMGGTLLLEAVGVTLSAGSTGVLSGFFVGMETQAECTAGFQATAQQGTGAVTLQPIVQGTPAGITYAINPANQYTLRTRVHCDEIERDLAIYRSHGDSGTDCFWRAVQPSSGKATDGDSRVCQWRRGDACNSL